MCKTGDLRDRVYGFIGLADPIYGIVPNYKITVADVFTNATARILMKEQTPDVILEALGNIPQWTPHLPTWVADWSCSQRLRRNILGTNSFSASAGYEGSITFLFPEARKDGSSYGCILRIKALRLDALSLPDLFPPVESGQDDEAADMTVLEWMVKTMQHLMGAENSDLYARRGLSDALVRLFYFEGTSGSREASMVQDSALMNVLPNFLESKMGIHRQWPFFATPNGFMGRASPGTRHDDDLFLALGASIPMILRKVEGQDCYTLVGEAYVHEMMDGEAIKLMEKGKLHVEEVDII